MKTILTISADKAAEFIKQGGLTAFPTETVYGLGADVFNEAAIVKIFEAKGRPPDNPLIAHIGDTGQLDALAREITPAGQKFIDAFFPGALTLVLPKADAVPLIASAGLDTIGVRMPRHRQALEFLQLCGVPLVAPSANLSGRPSPTTWQAVFEDLDGRIDCILQGSATDIGLESTVVDCTGDVPLVLRSGAVSLEELQRIVPETRAFTSDRDEAPRSPGLKHKHYSPKAEVILVDDISLIPAAAGSAYIGLTKLTKVTGGDFQGFGLVKICGSVTEYAHTVFEFFRECDRRGIEKIFCQTVAADGLGLALMDRLNRASEK